MDILQSTYFSEIEQLFQDNQIKFHKKHNLKLNNGYVKGRSEP